MKRFMSILLVITIVFGMSTSAFAVERLDGEEEKANFETNLLSNLIVGGEIDKEIEISDKSFSLHEDDLNVIIPKDGQESLQLVSEDFGVIKRNVSISSTNMEATMAADGSIVYMPGKNDESVSMCIQPLNES